MSIYDVRPFPQSPEKDLVQQEAHARKLLTVKAACARLAISKTLLRKEMEKHRLPVVRIGRKLFIPIESCDALIDLGVREFGSRVFGPYKSSPKRRGGL
jgi:excisionase family DNA binding protein